MSDAVSKAGVAPAAVSAPIVVSDVVPGAHTLELVRDCYVRVSNKIAVDAADDYTVGPIVLKPAVASLSVKANEPKAQVFIDGVDRGAVPFTRPISAKARTRSSCARASAAIRAASKRAPASRSPSRASSSRRSPIVSASGEGANLISTRG